MTPSAIVVTTTTSEKREAEQLCTAILERRLAACAQVSGPIESSYWWNTRLETSREWVCTFKTRRDLFTKLEAALLELHPYDEPEIVGVPVVEISKGYWKWLCEQVKPKAA